MLGAIILPGAEHCVPRHYQLLVRVLRKIVLRVLLDDFLVFRDDFLQCLSVELGIELGLLFFFLAVEDFFERMLLDIEHHTSEHLNQTAIRIVSKPRIVAQLRQRFHTLIVETKVENGVHHAGHGKLCARTHADEQRVFALAELLALQLFELAQRDIHLSVHGVRDAPHPHVLATSFSLNGESRRHGQARVGHLSKTRTLTAENVLHLAIAIGLAAAEGVHKFSFRL